MTAALLLVLFLAVVIGALACMDTHEIPRPKRPEPPVPSRKARFAEYVRGERQLMDEWGEAFGPEYKLALSRCRRELHLFHDDPEFTYGAYNERKRTCDAIEKMVA